MEAGFKNQTLDNRQEINGIFFWLLEPLVYTCRNGQTLRVMAGTRSDGGSIPKEFQNLISARGKLLWTFILHDGAFQDRLELLTPAGNWIKFTLNESDSNELLKEAARLQGANEVELETIYTALQLFGRHAFKADRAA